MQKKLADLALDNDCAGQKVKIIKTENKNILKELSNEVFITRYHCGDCVLIFTNKQKMLEFKNSSIYLNEPRVRISSLNEQLTLPQYDTIVEIL